MKWKFCLQVTFTRYWQASRGGGAPSRATPSTRDSERNTEQSDTMTPSSVLLIGLVTILFGTPSSGVRREKKQRIQGTTTTAAAAAEIGGGGGGGMAADEELSLRPGFRRAPQNVSVSPGDKAVLKCRVENLGAKTVTWRRYGDVHPLTIGLSTFVADSRVSVEFAQRVGEWNLVIRDIRPLDDGIYQCQINTKDDQHNYHTVYLQVKAVQVRGTGVVSRGDSIQLVCNATGRPDPPRNVEWYKDGRLIESEPGGGLIITKKVETAMLVSVLAIRRSRLSDAGIYFCRSSANEVGQIDVTVVNDSNRRGTSSAEKITSGALSVSSLVATSVRSGLPYFCFVLVSTAVRWNARSVRIRGAIVDIQPT